MKSIENPEPQETAKFEVVRNAQHLSGDNFIALPTLCGCGSVCFALIDDEDA